MSRRLLLWVGVAWTAWIGVVMALELHQALTMPREVPRYEAARTGDFDGDGRADVITFTRADPKAVGQVYVTLSDGAQFVNKRGRRGRSSLWNNWFVISDSEQILVGDFNGDGRDDVASWLGSSTREMYVALSTGKAMAEATVWATEIGFDPRDSVLAGDVDADGKDDVVCFSPATGRITISFSNGSVFAAPETELFQMH